MIGFLKRFFGQPQQAEGASALSDAQVVAAVAALSGDDERALQLVQQFQAGNIAQNNEFAELLDEDPVVASIAGPLDTAGRLAMFDWTSDTEPCFEEFAKLFAVEGIDTAEIAATVLS